MPQPVANARSVARPLKCLQPMIRSFARLVRPREWAVEMLSPGTSAPLGATVCDDGVNFSVFSRNATSIDLLLFDDANAPAPSTILPLDGTRHRTYHYWHAFVPGLEAGQVYA